MTQLKAAWQRVVRICNTGHIGATDLVSENFIDFLVAECLRDHARSVRLVPFVVCALPVVWSILVFQCEGHLQDGSTMSKVMQAPQLASYKLALA